MHCGRIGSTGSIISFMVTHNYVYATVTKSVTQLVNVLGLVPLGWVQLPPCASVPQQVSYASTLATDFNTFV